MHRVINRSVIVTISGAAFLFFASAASHAAEAPDLRNLPGYQTPIGGPRTERADYNLGPTGMRGWIYGYYTDQSDSREILVRVVDEGSPADGHLRKFDIITGVDGNRFNEDAREELARAITASESTGKLRLLRVRDGVETEVVLDMEILGDYSPTAPYDCLKSERIVTNAADFIATELLPERSVCRGVARPMNALLLLSTGEARYMPIVRRYARAIANEMAAIRTWEDALKLWTWHYGYKNMFLCEYYLATGDRTVLPAIENVCALLARGQGLPGSWCHSLSVTGHIMPGYGAVNSTGLVCFISLGLASRTPVKMEKKAIADCFAFFGSFVARGGIPYGDHSPTGGAANNGKSGIAAVSMHVMEAPKSAEFFSRLAASTNHTRLYSGHTGNFWNHTWTPLGANLAGRQALIDFFARCRGNYELCRRWDHGGVTNPDYNQRECYAARRKYGGPQWGPGAFNLFLTAPQKSLRILGAHQSVFAKDGCPSSLLEAMAFYRSFAYYDCATMLERMNLSGLDELKRIQLLRAAKTAMRANDETLLAAATNIDQGDMYLASRQIASLSGVVDSRDGLLRDCAARLATERARELIELGDEYYQIAFGYSNDHIRFIDEYTLHPMIRVSPNLRAKLSAIASNPKAGIYRGKALRVLTDNPLHPYQRVRHEWLRLSEYSPLTPIFYCAEAGRKNVPNTDVQTIGFSPDPGKRISVMNKSVDIEYCTFKRGTESNSKFKWTPGKMPFGTSGRKPPPGAKALPAGHTLRCRVTFNIANPRAFSDYFITCKSTHQTKIMINGKTALDFGVWKASYRLLHLKKATAALFKPGKNVIEAEVVPGDDRAKVFLDFGLDGLGR